MATNDSNPTPVKQERDNKLVGSLVIVVIVTALVALIGFLFLKPESDVLAIFLFTLIIVGAILIYSRIDTFPRRLFLGLVEFE